MTDRLPFSPALSGFFAGADEARRQQGQVLERLGFGPQTTPSRTVQKRLAAHLLAYQAPDARQPAILMVPAPIKTAYIWDLAPGSSAVQRCLAAGLQVYLTAWQRPRSGDDWLGLGEYADQVLRGCLDSIREETGQAAVLLAGHSLGGTLAAIFSSLYPHRVRGLIELEGPMAFGAGQLEAALASGPPARAITGLLGNIPGSVLTWASLCADPLTFSAEPWLDWLESSRSRAAHRLHWQVRRWSLDESPMAQRLFEEVEDQLYRENRFAEGRLRVGDRLAEPQAIDMPILAVVDARSRIVPPPAIDAYRTRTGSDDVRVLHYPGDTGVFIRHVGVLVGRNAHESLWPQILRWIGRRVSLA
jgi:polyhydroxyalkanoate synthase subunit PhaC